MSNSPKLPELLPPSPRPPRWQFGLWYLFVLTTVVAAIAGLMRRYLSDVPWLFVGMGIYFFGILAYMLWRLPMTIDWMKPEHERLRENRRRLKEWAEKRRRS